MTKPMTTEEMAAKLERNAKFIADTNPERALEYTFIARRLRLLEAEKQAWRFLDGVSVGGLVIAAEVVSKARAALDADERGENPKESTNGSV